MVGVAQKNPEKAINFIFYHGLIKVLVLEEFKKHSITWEEFLQRRGILEQHVNQENQVAPFHQETDFKQQDEEAKGSTIKKRVWNSKTMPVSMTWRYETRSLKRQAIEIECMSSAYEQAMEPIEQSPSQNAQPHETSLVE